MRAGGALQCVPEVRNRPAACLLTPPSQLHMRTGSAWANEGPVLQELYTVTRYTINCRIVPCRLEPTHSGRHKEEVL